MKQETLDAIIDYMTSISFKKVIDEIPEFKAEVLDGEISKQEFEKIIESLKMAMQTGLGKEDWFVADSTYFARNPNLLFALREYFLFLEMWFHPELDPIYISCGKLDHFCITAKEEE